MDEPMFRSVQHALVASYAWEGRTPLKVAAAFADMRGSTVRRASELTPLDWIAQSALTRRVIRQSLTERLYWLIEARYTHPAPGLVERKREACKRVQREFGPLIRRLPTDFYRDAVRVWAGFHPARTDSSWADKLEVGRTTIHHWRRGRGDARHAPGVETVLNDEAARALIVLEEPFIRAGLCPSLEISS